MLKKTISTVLFSVLILGMFSYTGVFNQVFGHHIIKEIPVKRPMGLSISNSSLYSSEMGYSASLEIGYSAVSVINTTSDNVISIINSTSKAGILDVISTPKKIYMAPFDSGTIEVYNKTSKNLLDIIHLPGAEYTIPAPLSNEILPKAEFVRGIWAFDYDPQNKVLYAAYMNANEILAINTTNDKIIKSIPVTAHPIAIQVDPLTNTILVASIAGDKLAFISTETNQILGEIETGRGPWHIALDNLYHKAYVTNRGDNYVTVVDTIGRQIIDKIPISSPGQAITVDQNDHVVYVSHENDQNIDKINGKNNQLITTINIGTIPQDLVVDSNTHKLYVSTKSFDKIFVIGPESVSSTIPVISFETPFVILGNIQVHGQDVKPKSILSVLNNTLILSVSAPDGGNVGLDIPRTLLDSKAGSSDIPFKVLLTDKEPRFGGFGEKIESSTTNISTTSRGLDFYVPEGTHRIAIVGTHSLS